MNSEKIKWCLCKKDGIEIIELKPHLSKSYIEEADETMENVFSAKGKWKTIMAYYACYNALYSILMKCGIKCEIHECTIELMGMFGFTEDEVAYMRQLKDDRIQAQYYLKNIVIENEGSLKKFVSRCKAILCGLDSIKIEAVRNQLSELKAKCAGRV